VDLQTVNALIDQLSSVYLIYNNQHVVIFLSSEKRQKNVRSHAILRWLLMVGSWRDTLQSVFDRL